MAKEFNNVGDVPRVCHYCDFRHCCSKDFDVSEDYLCSACPDFELGGCFTCKFHGLNGEHFDDTEASHIGGRCVSINIFDFQKCSNYKKDKELWKQWKAYRKSYKKSFKRLTRNKN